MPLPQAPLVCIVVAYFLVYLPHFLALGHRLKLPGGFENNYPRDQTARLEGWAKRASAAHQNGFETFAPFAIATVLASISHANEHTVTMLTIAFVVLRALYVALYIANFAAPRSLVWTCSVATTATLFVLPLRAA
jgi:uncharacterized MAPEG superfamily protein